MCRWKKNVRTIPNIWGNFVVNKICYKCNIEKEYPKDFTKGKNFCKICRNKELKDKRDKNRKPKQKVSKEHKLQKILEWQKNNPDKRKAAIKKYHLSHKYKEKIYYQNNKENIKIRNKKWKNNNRDKINISIKHIRKNPLINLRHNISVLIRYYISGIKNGSIMKFLSYSIQDLKNHLEKQFESWMNWNNKGIYNPKTWNDSDSSTWTWQLDHIIPQSDLPYTSMDDENFKKCWALENLRPLSAKQNIIDGATRIRHKGKTNAN